MKCNTGLKWIKIIFFVISIDSLNLSSYSNGYNYGNFSKNLKYYKKWWLFRKCNTLTRKVHIVLPTEIRAFVIFFVFKVIVLSVFLFFIGFNLTVLISLVIWNSSKVSYDNGHIDGTNFVPSCTPFSFEKILSKLAVTKKWMNKKRQN